MTNGDGESWKGLLTWVKWYSWLIVAGALYGLLAAHLFALFGQPWTLCLENGRINWGCVWTFHLYEVPLVLYMLGVAYMGLKRLCWQSRHGYAMLLGLLIVVYVVFFTFEIQLLREDILNQAPALQSWALVSVAVALLAGAVLGLYTMWRLLVFIVPTET